MEIRWFYKGAIYPWDHDASNGGPVRQHEAAAEHILPPLSICSKRLQLFQQALYLLGFHPPFGVGENLVERHAAGQPQQGRMGELGQLPNQQRPGLGMTENFIQCNPTLPQIHANTSVSFYASFEESVRLFDLGIQYIPQRSTDTQFTFQIPDAGIHSSEQRRSGSYNLLQCLP